MPWCLNHKITGEPPNVFVAVVNLHLGFLGIIVLSYIKLKPKIKKTVSNIAGDFINKGHVAALRRSSPTGSIQ